MVRRTSTQHFLRVTFIFALIAVTAASAVAKPRHAKAPEPLVAVVAHLTLQGPPATKLLVQERSNQQYLLIEQASKEGFTIVDVTKPSQAKIVKLVAWPNQASYGKLQLIKAGLVLSATAETGKDSAAGNPPTESLTLFDLRDPANPQTIQGFSAVTAVLLDESRSLLYITNPEGLWILKYKQEEPSNPFGCPADHISTDPNCSN